MALTCRATGARSCCARAWRNGCGPTSWPTSGPASRRGGPITMAAALDGLPLDALAAALPPAPPPGLGSNVWVAAGSRTASGQPLLANDPHLRAADAGAVVPGAARGARAWR